MLVDMKCLRCQTTMKFIGTRNYLEGSVLAQWSQVTPRNTKANKEHFHFYSCPKCGKVEFFLPEPYYKDMDMMESAEGFHISTAKDSEPPLVSDLLKIKPGITTLDKVNKLIGLPYRYYILGETAVICYRSEDPFQPHILLVDQQNNIVRMLAVSNQDRYTSASLQHDFGTPQVLGEINQYKHFFFESKGVAYIAVDEKVLYVQFFEPKIRLIDYIKADGYSVEIFSYAD